jgi:hypothetical protein
MVRRHATVLLFVAMLAALAVWLHSCDVASETRTGAAPEDIAPRAAAARTTRRPATRATRLHDEPDRRLGGGPWISPATG